MTAKTLHGEARLKKSSSVTDAAAHAGGRQLLLLLCLGVAAVVLHELVRWPLNLPGHHGLEWMALLMFGRALSSHRWAATVAASGAAAASMLPVWGTAEPLVWLFYLLPGIVVDLLYVRALPRTVWLLYLGLIAALAHATKPLLRWLLAESFGWQFGSMTPDLWWPLTTHLVFGFTGGLIGACAWQALQRRR